MATESVLEKVEELERISEYFIKGWTPLQISRELHLPVVYIKQRIDEYKLYLSRRVEEDPTFLDRLAENTLRMLDELDMISKETWQVYEDAKDAEMLNQRTQTLKLAMDLLERKAKLHQLLGGKVEIGNMASMQRLERVNEIVSGIIRDIISECSNCRLEAQVRLAEAFKQMDKHEEAAQLQPLPSADYEQEENETIEVDIQNVMGDILGE